MNDGLKINSSQFSVTPSPIGRMKEWHTSEKRWFGVAVKILDPTVQGTHAKLTVYTRNIFSRFVNYFYKLVGGKDDNFLARKSEITFEDVTRSNLNQLVSECYDKIIDKRVLVTDHFVTKVAKAVLDIPPQGTRQPQKSTASTVTTLSISGTGDGSGSPVSSVAAATHSAATPRVIDVLTPPGSLGKDEPSLSRTEHGSPLHAELPFMKPVSQRVPSQNSMAEVVPITVKSVQIAFDKCFQALHARVKEFDANTNIPGAEEYSKQMSEVIGYYLEIFRGFLDKRHQVPDDKSGILVERKISEFTEKQSKSQPVVDALRVIIEEAEGALDARLSAYNAVCASSEELKKARGQFEDRSARLAKCSPYQAVLAEIFEDIHSDLEHTVPVNSLDFSSLQAMNRKAVEQDHLIERCKQAVKAYDDSPLPSYLEQLRKVDAKQVYLSSQGVKKLRTRFIDEEKHSIDEFHKFVVEQFDTEFASNELVKKYVGKKAVASSRKQLERLLSEVDALKETYVVRGFLGFNNQTKKVSELSVAELEAWKKEIAAKQQEFWWLEREKCPFDAVIEDLQNYDALCNLESQFRQHDRVPQFLAIRTLGEIVKAQQETLKVLNAYPLGLRDEVEERIRVLQEAIKNTKILSAAEQLSSFSPDSDEYITLNVIMRAQGLGEALSYVKNALQRLEKIRKEPHSVEFTEELEQCEMALIDLKIAGESVPMNVEGMRRYTKQAKAACEAYDQLERRIPRII